MTSTPFSAVPIELGSGGAPVTLVPLEPRSCRSLAAAIVAMDHDLDPQLVTLMVGIGIPLSFLTLFAWRQVLSVVA